MAQRVPTHARHQRDGALALHVLHGLSLSRWLFFMSPDGAWTLLVLALVLLASVLYVSLDISVSRVWRALVPRGGAAC